MNFCPDTLKTLVRDYDIRRKRPTRSLATRTCRDGLLAKRISIPGSVSSDVPSSVSSLLLSRVPRTSAIRRMCGITKINDSCDAVRACARNDGRWVYSGEQKNETDSGNMSGTYYDTIREFRLSFLFPNTKYIYIYLRTNSDPFFILYEYQTQYAGIADNSDFDK